MLIDRVAVAGSELTDGVHGNSAVISNCSVNAIKEFTLRVDCIGTVGRWIKEYIPNGVPILQEINLKEVTRNEHFY